MPIDRSGYVPDGLIDVAWITVSVMPHAGMTWHFSQASSSGMINPNAPTLMVCSGIGWLASALNTNGISEMWVTPWAATTSQKRLDENFGCSTIVPQPPSVVHSDQLWALTWKNGRYTR